MPPHCRIKLVQGIVSYWVAPYKGGIEMLTIIKWIITKMVAIPLCLIIQDFKFKSYNNITWDDTWEILRMGGELLIIGSGFALPPIFIFPWYFRILVWVATVAIMMVLLNYEHNRYQERRHWLWYNSYKSCQVNLLGMGLTFSLKRQT